MTADVLPDPKRLRSLLATFATGVTVLTVGGATPRGMTANSFTSVSIEPPLVLVCVDRTAIMHASLHRAGAFGVSVLASDQEELARYFADHDRPPGFAQFEPVGWLPGENTGVPLIRGALAWFECGLWRMYDGGDHSIVVGNLISATRLVDGAGPLLFHQGGFHRLD
ncbi:flavin reductase family protein [Luedemannella flava]|uniref:Flavin reductase family protein n=1 Tax=Luedemannella flava TaxID=349316 RepID=A0ABN2LT81_9ACTN